MRDGLSELRGAANWNRLQAAQRKGRVPERVLTDFVEGGGQAFCPMVHNGESEK